MLDTVLWSAGALALVTGTLFAHLQRWSVSPPFLGLVVGVLIGPQVLGMGSVPADEAIHVMKVAARLLLAIALMAVALRYPMEQVRGRAREVGLLLLLVLPVMAAVVGLGAAWLLELPLAVALTLGAALSPTDPVLASSIVTGAAAEEDIPAHDRQILSLESGANDGLAMPLVILAVAWSLERPWGTEIGRAAWEVLGAILLGAVAGALSGWALRWADRHRQIGSPEQSFYTLALAALVLGASGPVGVDGLLGVFVAGLAHNLATTPADRRVEVAIDEPLSQFMVVPLFVLFGVVLPWGEWAVLGWAGLGVVAVALLLRRLPVVLALHRPLGGTWARALWLGWFGPIGVAALYYLGHVHAEGVTDSRVWAAGTLVVACSTVVHGFSAGPTRLAYGRRDATPDRRAAAKAPIRALSSREPGSGRQ